MVTVTNVRWALDQHGRPTLDLDLGQEMCEAIRTNVWQKGPRPVLV
jgi:hypothetical protein